MDKLLEQYQLYFIHSIHKSNQIFKVHYFFLIFMKQPSSQLELDIHFT